MPFPLLTKVTPEGSGAGLGQERGSGTGGGHREHTVDADGERRRGGAGDRRRRRFGQNDVIAGITDLEREAADRQRVSLVQSEELADDRRGVLDDRERLPVAGVKPSEGLSVLPPRSTAPATLSWS